MKYLFAFIVAIVFFIHADAQMAVRGIVADSASLKPIEGVNVWIKNGRTGTITDADGRFIIDLPEKSNDSITFSFVGFKTQTFHIISGDTLSVFLAESSRNLKEITVFQQKNTRAIALLRKVQHCRLLNNPDSLFGPRLYQHNETSFYFTDFNMETVTPSVFEKFLPGVIYRDSTFELPLYLQNRASISHVNDTSKRSIITDDVNFLHFLSQAKWNMLMDYYLPKKINFYNNTIHLLGKKTFVSPLAAFATQYYHYWLSDSLVMNDTKFYRLDFKPINDKNLLFVGSFWVSNKNYAVTTFDAELSSNINLNFVDKIELNQTFDTLPNGRYFFSKINYVLEASLDLGLDSLFRLNNATKPLGCVVTRNAEFAYASDYVPQQTKSDIYNQMWKHIDALNQTTATKNVGKLIDLLLNGYWHAGKWDVGPILNLMNYNRLEGFRPVVSVRTGKNMMKWLTFGGYLGYGTNDHELKYGGDFQWRFGKAKHHQIGLFYDNRDIRYGFEHISLYDENRVAWVDNLLTMPFTISSIPNMSQFKSSVFQYLYDNHGIRLTFGFRYSDIFGNSFIPFVQSGTTINSISVGAIDIGLRLSRQERFFDEYFHHYYVATNYPVLLFWTEVGRFNAGLYGHSYAKSTLILKHDWPMPIGNIYYMIEGNYVFGEVPFPLLYFPRGETTWYHSRNNFALMNDFEFAADKYVALYLNYRSNGLIFNMIPMVKKMNWRESFMFNIGYGSLRSCHQSILSMPKEFENLKIPYIETGFGIHNIFKIMSMESVWRLTHRNLTGTADWSIRMSVDLDF